MNHHLRLVLPTAVAAVVCLAACSDGTTVDGAGSAASGTTPQPTTTITQPGPDTVAATATSVPSDAEAALGQQAPERTVSVVDGTNIGVTYDERGDLEFWRYADTSWTLLGETGFPAPIEGGAPLQVRTTRLAADAHTADGGPVVLAVLTGQFTTDAGSGYAVFGPGKAGWGPLVRNGNSLTSTGARLAVEDGAGLYQNVTVTGGGAGRLNTAVCRDDLPRSECDDQHADVSTWAWDDAAQSFRVVTP